MFVGQQLLSAQAGPREALHFWVRETSRANAEVDFLVTRRNELLPIEVKSSAAGSLKSLHQFLWRSGRRDGVRLHEGESGTQTLSVKMPDGHLEYRLCSLPLWAAGLI